MTGNYTFADNTANTITGAIFPLLITLVLVFAVTATALFLVSERFQRLGGFARWFSRQFVNAAYGLLPVGAVAILGGIVYAVWTMPTGAKETSGLVLVAIVGGFAFLAVVGAGFRRVLERVKAVHPAWFPKPSTTEEGET